MRAAVLAAICAAVIRVPAGRPAFGAVNVDSPVPVPAPVPARVFILDRGSRWSLDADAAAGERFAYFRKEALMASFSRAAASSKVAPSGSLLLPSSPLALSLNPLPDFEAAGSD